MENQTPKNVPPPQGRPVSKATGDATGRREQKTQQERGQTPPPPTAAGAAPDGARGRKKTAPSKTGSKAKKAPPQRTAEPASAPPPQEPLRGFRLRKRHFAAFVSFLVLVCLPIGAATVYMTRYAADQFISEVGFSVQKEDAGSAIDLIGGITQISNGSSSDTDILYEFIQSQAIVAAVDKKVDLRAIFTKPENDPVYALSDNATVEDLTEYWQRMVRIFYNGSNGLIQLQIHAFTPEDALTVAHAVFDESTALINNLSQIALNDATRYAKDELDLSSERLKVARQKLTSFRNEHQIVDPNANLQSQMGLISTLQAQLADALISYDILIFGTREDDPRIAQAERRIDVIRTRIDEEQSKFSSSADSDGNAYSSLIETYEGLAVELEFAQNFYVSALNSYESARAEALRKSRYLAAYVGPTEPSSSLYPNRPATIAILGFFAFLIWATIVMVFYSVRDRR